MNLQDVAKTIDGGEYGREFDGIDWESVKNGRIVVVSGYSDDVVSLRGSINDETSIGTFEIDEKGVRRSWEELNSYDTPSEDEAAKFFRRKEMPAVTIDASFKDRWKIVLSNCELPADTYETFKVWEDGLVFCEGLVIDLDGALLSQPGKRPALAN